MESCKAHCLLRLVVDTVQRLPGSKGAVCKLFHAEGFEPISNTVFQTTAQAGQHKSPTVNVTEILTSRQSHGISNNERLARVWACLI